MANLTVDSVYGYAQDLLKFEGSTIGLPGLEETRAINWVNDLHKQFFQEFYVRRMVLPDYLSGHVGYDSGSATTLTNATVAGQTSFAIGSSSALDSSGAAVVYDTNLWELFTFTGNASGTVSGVPSSGNGALMFAHAAGLSVEKLYALPSDFGQMRPGKDRGDGVVVNGIEYFAAAQFPGSEQFSVYQGPTGAWFLWLPRGISGQVMVQYDKVPTELTQTTSTLDIQAPHHMYVVWGLVAIFKQILDEGYVPTLEQQKQQTVIEQALAKRSAGRQIRGSRTFFNRTRI